MHIFNFINQANENCRVDVCLFRFLDEQNHKISRTNITNIINTLGVFVNDLLITKPSHLVRNGDRIKFTLQNQNNVKIIQKIDLNLDIIFENENLLIINKPKNIIIHPGAGEQDFTLVNALENYLGKGNLSDIRGDEKAGILHRLDKDTTGLLIIAKNNKIHYLLGEMMKNRQIEKKYLSICYGVPVPSSSIIQNYIKRDNKDITKMMIDEEQISDKSKLAITEYKVLKVFFNGAFSLVESTLITGRTHQIRLHLLSIKKPIVGDQKYDNINYRYYKGILDKNILHPIITEVKKIKTQMLHSYSLNFIEPITMEHINIQNYPNFSNFNEFLMKN